MKRKRGFALFSDDELKKMRDLAYASRKKNGFKPKPISAKSHCNKGHELIPGNIRIAKRQYYSKPLDAITEYAYIVCLTCRHESNTKFKAKKLRAKFDKIDV